jgi:hypothetical protein
VGNVDFYGLFFCIECVLTFDHTHAIEGKEREFGHGSPISNSTTNLAGIGNIHGVEHAAGNTDQVHVFDIRMQVNTAPGRAILPQGVLEALDEVCFPGVLRNGFMWRSGSPGAGHVPPDRRKEGWQGTTGGRPQAASRASIVGASRGR